MFLPSEIIWQDKYKNGNFSFFLLIMDCYIYGETTGKMFGRDCP